MNRRSFFKAVTGFVAGVFATTLPKEAKEKHKVTLTMHVGTDKEITSAWQPIKENPEIEDGIIYEYIPLHEYMEKAPHSKQLYGCFDVRGKLTGFYYKV